MSNRLPETELANWSFLPAAQKRVAIEAFVRPKQRARARYMAEFTEPLFHARLGALLGMRASPAGQRQ